MVRNPENHPKSCMAFAPINDNCLILVGQGGPTLNGVQFYLNKMTRT
jgi:hypothetical protein